MDFWTDIAFAVLLRLLKSERDTNRVADAMAKVFVAISAQAGNNPVLWSAIERQRQK